MPVVNKYKSRCAKFLRTLDLPEEEFKRTLDKMTTFMDSGARGKTLSNKIRDFARRMRDLHEIELKNRNNIALINIIKEEDVLERLSHFGDNITEGVYALLRGSNHQIRGARDSIDVTQKNYSQGFAARFVDDLEKAGVLEDFRSSHYDREIMDEYYRQFNKDPSSEATPNIKKIAEILHKHDRLIVKQLNEAGGMIERHAGFLFRTGHDRTKLIDAEFDKWREDSERFFNVEEMEKGLDTDFTTFLREIFDDLSTGKHQRVHGADDGNVPLGYLSSTANLARKVSSKSRLIFKDGQSHFDYMQLYGNNDSHIRDTIVFGFEHSGRNLGLMEVLGPNPKAMLKNIIGQRARELQKRNGKAFREQFDDLVSGLPRGIDEAYAELDGSTRIPGNASVAKWSAGLRVLHNIALLGNVLIRSVNDFATVISEARFQGMRWGKAVGIHMNSIKATFGHDADKKSFLRYIGIGQQALLGDAVGRFSGDDVLTGAWSRGQSAYFRLNMITQWNDALKSSFALMQAGHFGDQAGKTLSELRVDNKAFARLLDLFDIDEHDWDIMASTLWTTKDGERFITPDKIEELSNEAITAYLKRKGTAPDDTILTSFAEELKGIKKRQQDFKTRFDKDRREGFFSDLEEAQIRLDRVANDKKEKEIEIFALEQKIKRAKDFAKTKGKNSSTKSSFPDSAGDPELPKRDLTGNEEFVGVTPKELDKMEGELRNLKGERKRLSETFNEEEKLVKKVTDSKFVENQLEDSGVAVSTDKFSDRQIEKARHKLSQKLQSAFMDRNDFAVLIPGARERAAFNRGTQTGTPMGEALRFLAQFKTFPLSVYTRPLERDILKNGAASVKEGLNFFGPRGGDVAALAGFAAGMSVYGAIGMMATDAIKGVTVRDWSDPRTYVDAAILGGAFGLGTDFALGPYSSNAEFSKAKALLGPVMGNAVNLADLIQGALAGDNVAKKGIHLLHTIMPTANLFYVRALWDYLVWFNLQEAFSPGSISKMERALKKRTGQEFKIPPRNVVPRGGSANLPGIAGNFINEATK